MGDQPSSLYGDRQFPKLDREYEVREFFSRIYVDEPAGMVLGSNAMMDKEVYFDIANKMMGVGKSPCVY